MRHLNHDYPYQKPSKNRSSKDLNLLIGGKENRPFYRTLSKEQLKTYADKGNVKAMEELTRRNKRAERRAANKQKAAAN